MYISETVNIITNYETIFFSCQLSQILAYQVRSVSPDTRVVNETEPRAPGLPEFM